MDPSENDNVVVCVSFAVLAQGEIILLGLSSLDRDVARGLHPRPHILYMSYFFKSSELPFRLALFWLSNRVTNVVSPLLAFGLLHLGGVEGREGWRWLVRI